MNRGKGWKLIIVFALFICVSLNRMFKSFDTDIILYSSDISINGDFDDYFDLVSIMSLNNVELKIIVDGNDIKEKQSGAVAIENLLDIGKDKKITVIIGRDTNLSTLMDAEVNDDLVKILEKAKRKIDIVTVGSLRDIAALYNNSTELFERKVRRIWVFAGDAEGTMLEYNVALDEVAFLRIMNSRKMDIYWIPCFQNGIWTSGSNASYFNLNHNEVFCGIDDDLQKWFLYRYEKSDVDFQEYVKSNYDFSEFMSESRNIWCAPLFPLINDSMDEYLSAYNQEHNKNIDIPFGFKKQQVTFSEGGEVEYGGKNVINLFEIYDYDEYVNFSIFIIRSMFSNW